MKRMLLLLPMVGLSLTSCSMVNQTMNSLECNQQAVDASTQAINQNAYAIEMANRNIEDNIRQLNAMNETLNKVRQSQ